MVRIAVVAALATGRLTAVGRRRLVRTVAVVRRATVEQLKQY